MTLFTLKVGNALQARITAVQGHIAAVNALSAGTPVLQAVGSTTLPLDDTYLTTSAADTLADYSANAGDVLAAMRTALDTLTNENSAAINTTWSLGIIP